MPAWRTQVGIVSLREPLDTEAPRDYLRIPCGRCLGCIKSKAREWAIRGQLELRDHEHAAFVTLTYAPKYVPPTLSRDHLSLYYRYVRRKLPKRRVRVFGCGEYGEENGRPHYHAVMYGVHHLEDQLEAAWGKGFVTATPVTPERIAYTAGYTAKKVADAFERRFPTECVDPETGECFVYQPPFLQMSRNPGIGANARETYWRSWRSTAISGNVEIPVPRYLHQGWIKHTTPEEHEALDREKIAKAKTRPILTKDHLRAAGEIALARHHLNRQNRSL